MSGADLLVVAGALTLTAAGFVVGARTGARLVVRRALSAPAPEVRQAAVRLAAHTGLEPHLKALLERTRVEQDRRVLATLAGAVSTTVPGPDDPPVLDELRLWARSYADTGPPPPPASRGRERNVSWVLPVVLCNVAAVAGAVAGAGVGGTGLALAGSALFAGGVLVVYAGRSMAAGRSGGEETARQGRAAPVPPVVATAPAGEPTALETLSGPTPPPGDDVIDLRGAGRGRVEAGGPDRSAAAAFWDVTVPDDEVKELLEKRERQPGGARRPAPRRRPGRAQQ